MMKAITIDHSSSPMTSVNDLVVDEHTALAVAEMIVDSGAYTIGDFADRSTWFRYSSGLYAPVYGDMRRAVSDSGHLALASSYFGSAIINQFPGIEVIAGMADAAWPLLTDIASKFPQLESIYIRKEEKKHGKGSWFLTPPLAGATAVLVDDLVNSGSSIQRGFDRLKEAEVKVLGVVSIVNWGQAEMFSLCNEMQIKPVALTSWPWIVKTLESRERITSSEAEVLRKFYQNMSTFNWETKQHECK